MEITNTVKRRLDAYHVPLTCLLNAIVALLSLILIVVMGHALSDPDVYLHLTRPYLDALEEDLMKYQSPMKIDRKAVDYLVFTRSIIKVKLAFDTCVLVCCLTGIMGALLRKKCVLLVYIVVMFIFFLAEVNLLILIHGRRVKLESQRVSMKASLQEDYEGLFSDNPTSVMWNSIMVGAGCCGVDGYRDFNVALRWHKSRNITLKGASVPVRGDMPLACCKRDAARRVSYILNSYELPPNVTSPYYDPLHPALKELACSVKSHKDGNNKDRGCHTILMEMVEFLTNSVTAQVCDPVCLLCEALVLFLFVAAVLLDASESADENTPSSSHSRPKQDATSKTVDERKSDSSEFPM